MTSTVLIPTKSTTKKPRTRPTRPTTSATTTIRPTLSSTLTSSTTSTTATSTTTTPTPTKTTTKKPRTRPTRPTRPTTSATQTFTPSTATTIRPTASTTTTSTIKTAATTTTPTSTGTSTTTATTSTSTLTTSILTMAKALDVPDFCDNYDCTDDVHFENECYQYFKGDADFDCHIPCQIFNCSFQVTFDNPFCNVFVCTEKWEPIEPAITTTSLPPNPTPSPLEWFDLKGILLCVGFGLAGYNYLMFSDIGKYIK